MFDLCPSTSSVSTVSASGTSGASGAFVSGCISLSLARPAVRKTSASGSGEYVIAKSPAQELRAHAKRLPLASRKEAFALADTIDALVRPLGSGLALECSWGETGSLIAEWIASGSRFGFAFEVDVEPSWFHVNPRQRLMRFGVLRDPRMSSELDRFFATER